MSDPNQDHAVRIALLEHTTIGIKEELGKLNGHIGKLVWAIIMALVLGFIQFVIKGGLHG
jgi:hypothetical protein